MAVGWKPLLPLIAVSALFIYEEWVSSPSCKRLPSPNLHGHEPNQDHPDNLKVMMVANLLLLGSEAGYFNLLFRDYYLSRFCTRNLRPFIFMTMNFLKNNSTIFIVLVILLVVFLSNYGVEATRVLPEDFAHANHLQTHYPSLSTKPQRTPWPVRSKD